MFKSRFPILANLSLFFAGCILSLLLFASADDAELAALHYQKGQNFLKGKGENQSYPQAVMHFRLAAEMEHGGATARLAWLQDYLQNESSLKIRYRRTMQLAKENNAAAQFELGQMCEFGLGVEADIERAKNWYRQGQH